MGREKNVKSVWLGIGLVALIGVGAWLATSEVLVTSSADSYASPNGTVRLDDSD